MTAYSISQLHVAFIVRATVKDGLGHLVRSLSVLLEMRGLANVQLFLLGDTSGRHLIEESGVSWAECRSDQACVHLVLAQRPPVVVFDTLHFDQAAFDFLADKVVTISLSPVFSCMDDVGYLFHRTLHEAPEWRGGRSFPKVYKGLKYTVLPAWLTRVTTRQYRENLHEHKQSIAISMGGSDAPNRTLSLLKELSRNPKKLVIWVALGDAYTHSYEDLLRCAKENRQEIILVKSNESMWRVLRNASLVICAGGLTTYEAAYVGIPSINILQNAEWSYLFSELSSEKICYVLQPSEYVFVDAAGLVSELLLDSERLLAMHNLSKGLIPSGGARRIAKIIASLRGPQTL